MAPVLGTLDGHGPYVWFIDTGSAYTTIDPRVAAELNLHAVASGRSHDLSDEHRRWTGTVSEGQIHEWKVGNLTVANPRFTIARIDVATWAGHPVAGYLGIDTIRYMTLEVDYDAQVARLGMPGEIPLPQGAAHAYVTGEQLYVDVSLAGATRSFKVRSAASVSTLFPAAAEQLRLPASGKKGMLPTFGEPKETDIYVLPAIAIGGTQRREVALLAQPIAKPDDTYGSLGGDFLEGYHWYVDVQGGRMALVPRATHIANIPLATPEAPATCPADEATIRGVVRHTSGRPLPKINVVAQQVGGASRADATDENGRFRICIAPGTYTIYAMWRVAKQKQMSVFERPRVKVSAGEVTEVDPELDENCNQPGRGLVCANVRE
jgi:hypothetical protein